MTSSLSLFTAICYVTSFYDITIMASTFHLGVLLPMWGDRPVGRTASGAVTYTLNRLNSDPTLTYLRKLGHRFEIIWRNTSCEATSLADFVELWALKDQNIPDVDAFIGPACDNVCGSAAMLAGIWGIPIISYGCVYSTLSDKKRAPTFARTVAPSNSMIAFIVRMVQEFKWPRIVVVENEQAYWHSVGTGIKQGLTFDNVKTIGFDFFSPIHTRRSPAEVEYLKQRLEVIKEQGYVFFLCMDHKDIVIFLGLADSLEMLSDPGYAFVTINIYFPHPDAANLTQEISYFQGVLDVSPHYPIQEERQRNFIRDVRRHSMEGPFNIPLHKWEQVDVQAFALHDAMYLYAEALNESLSKGVEVSDKLAISKYLFNRTFHGIQGPTFINQNGDPIGEYSLRNFQNYSWVIVMDQQVIIDKDGKHSFKTSITKEILWPGKSKIRVTGEPPCGWEGEHCPNYWVAITSVTLTIVVLLGMALTAILLYRRYLKKSIEQNISWKIPFLEITLDYSQSRSNVFGSRFSKGSDFSELSLNTRSSNFSRKTSRMNNQVFTNIGRYKGALVALKYINKVTLVVTKEIIDEINNIRNLNHINVNPLLGASVDPHHVCVITTYCAKGSLQDVLENDNIKLEWIFKLSFASDIAHGMAYIHSSPVYQHGRLKSSNVVIDSRWTCKVTDIYMPRFRESELPEKDKNTHYQMLWMAPELLRSKDPDPRGTKKADVYSFAIILQEILLRSGPFGDGSMPPEEIVTKVKALEQPPFRPQVGHTEEEEEELVDLMRLCWEEIPSFRPNFSTIRDSLKKMNKGRQLNLVDQMVLMMEKYTNHLEDLVENRTQQLAEEQKKTEELLCRMLPKAIAEKLKKGNTVNPEEYSSCTIFFSDIVGFTSLAANSTPLQVVDFLNDLYSCFDTIIENFDVYKVETIGDAYMVVSGLPIPNGILHAGEICTMALELLSAIRDFKIRHLPDKQLQLRIGVHTGPVVTGVVGLKMPRYCLFGDTVNYTSRMESSGLALRIHVSPECKNVLDQLGGYILEERGLVHMKGKGKITTYFLMGKDGFLKPLPDLALAASYEEHEFK